MFIAVFQANLPYYYHSKNDLKIHSSDDWETHKWTKFWNCLSNIPNIHSNSCCPATGIIAVIIFFTGTLIVSVVGAGYTFFVTIRYKSALTLFAESIPELVEASKNINFAHLMNFALLSAIVLSAVSWIYRLYLCYYWEGSPPQSELRKAQYAGGQT